jgi:hypothetical protein
MRGQNRMKRKEMHKRMCGRECCVREEKKGDRSSKRQNIRSRVSSEDTRVVVVGSDKMKSNPLGCLEMLQL